MRGEKESTLTQLLNVHINIFYLLRENIFTRVEKKVFGRAIFLLNVWPNMLSVIVPTFKLFC